MVPVSVRRQRRARRLQQPRLRRLRRAARRDSDEPARRLARIRGEMDGVKQSKQAVAGDVLASLSGFAPPLLLALGSRLVTVSPRLNMHTATTNVPGPQQPVQTLGRRMLESLPVRPVVGSIRIVVAIFSYDGGPVLRRHRRLRRRARHRRAGRRHRARHGGSAGARRAAQAGATHVGQTARRQARRGRARRRRRLTAAAGHARRRRPQSVGSETVRLLTSIVNAPLLAR